jgi:hypothetical protein
LRKLHNEELHGLYSSPDSTEPIKSRMMRLAGHVAHMGGEQKFIGGFWWGKLNESNNLEDLGVNVGERGTRQLVQIRGARAL